MKKKLSRLARDTLSVGRVATGLRGLGWLWSVAITFGGLVLAATQRWWTSLHLIPQVLLATGSVLAAAWGIRWLQIKWKDETTSDLNLVMRGRSAIECGLAYLDEEYEKDAWIVRLEDTVLANPTDQPMLLEVVLWLVMKNDGRSPRRPYAHFVQQALEERVSLPDNLLRPPIGIEPRSHVAGGLAFMVEKGHMAKWGGVSRIYSYVLEFRDAFSGLSLRKEWGDAFPDRPLTDEELRYPPPSE